MRRKNKLPIGVIIRKLKEHTEMEKAPIVTYVANLTNDPFRILISCILSLRTKDQTTTDACLRLFEAAHTPEGMLKISQDRIAKLIYPVGFYNVKARSILEISRILRDEYGGTVPDDLDTLMTLPGVGRKTANLVITEAYDEYGICVDTHVHRITNRLGYIKTRNPYETEFALRKKLPKQYWKEINTLLVKFGQTICVPISPHCSQCRISRYCRRIGVKRHR